MFKTLNGFFFYTVLEEKIKAPVLKKARKDGVKREKPLEWPLTGQESRHRAGYWRVAECGKRSKYLNDYVNEEILVESENVGQQVMRVTNPAIRLKTRRKRRRTKTNKR